MVDSVHSYVNGYTATGFTKRQFETLKELLN